MSSAPSNSGTFALQRHLMRLERAGPGSREALAALLGLLAHARGNLAEELLIRGMLDVLSPLATKRDEVRAAIERTRGELGPLFVPDGIGGIVSVDLLVVVALDRHWGVGDGRRPESDWHRILARACLDWNELEGAAERYALTNVVHHCVRAGLLGTAAEVLTDFGYHFRRLRVMGPGAAGPTAGDFSLLEHGRVSEDVHREILEWMRFYRSISHHLQRRFDWLAPEIVLLQRSLEQGRESSVSTGAAQWLTSTGSPRWWLRHVIPSTKSPKVACLCTLEGHWDEILAVATHPDGQLVISGGKDRTIKVWDLASGECVYAFTGHEDRVTAVIAHQDGRRIISASADSTLKVWDLERERCLHTLTGHGGPVRALALHPDGGAVFSGGEDRTLKIWRLDHGVCVQSLDGGSPIEAVAAHPDGIRVIAGCRDSQVKVWDIRTGQLF